MIFMVWFFPFLGTGVPASTCSDTQQRAVRQKCPIVSIPPPSCSAATSSSLSLATTLTADSVAQTTASPQSGNVCGLTSFFLSHASSWIKNFSVYVDVDVDVDVAVMWK